MTEEKVINHNLLHTYFDADKALETNAKEYLESLDMYIPSYKPVCKVSLKISSEEVIPKNINNALRTYQEGYNYMTSEYAKLAELYCENTKQLIILNNYAHSLLLTKQSAISETKQLKSDVTEIAKYGQYELALITDKLKSATNENIQLKLENERLKTSFLTKIKNWFIEKWNTI